MKKKIFIISLSLFIVLLAATAVFFMLMKGSESGEGEDSGEGVTTGEIETGGESGEYALDIDVESVVNTISFFKLNTTDELVAYIAEGNVCTQPSSASTLFGVGELYINDSPTDLYYSLNDDGSLLRFDGYCSYTLTEVSEGSVKAALHVLDSVAARLFGLSTNDFEHSIYNEIGAPIYGSENAYTLFAESKASYGLSVFDEYGTYWYMRARLSENVLNVEFFRCYDVDMYSDNSPNIDLYHCEEDASPSEDNITEDSVE